MTAALSPAGVRVDRRVSSFLKSRRWRDGNLGVERLEWFVIHGKFGGQKMDIEHALEIADESRDGGYDSISAIALHFLAAEVRSLLTDRASAMELAIKAIEESQPPETTPWDCVDAIRRKFAKANAELKG
jgi:4-alpha-glucanotransferase